jgi:hypothetical protein
MDFLPSRSSMPSLGLALINEIFIWALLSAYSYVSAHKFLDSYFNHAEKC